MAWNYRVFVQDGQSALYEVLYHSDGSIGGLTEKPVFPRRESLEELIEDFERYQRALAEPVLDYDAFDHS